MANDSKPPVISNSSVLDPSELPVTSTAYLAIGISMSVLFCFGVPENILVLYVYRKTGKLHTKTNIWIVSVVICDLLILVCAFSFVIVSSFSEEFVFGTIGCHWDGFIVTFLGTTSIFLLTGLSVHRYIIICDFRRKQFKVNRKKVYCAILCCFSCGLLWAIFPLLGWGSYALEGIRISCAPLWKSSNTSDQSYILCLFISVLFIPCLLLGFCYLKIVYKVCKAFYFHHFNSFLHEYLF